MQILKYFILFLPVFTTFSSYGQIIFEKTYGNAQEERGEGIVQLPDSSYIVVGATSSFGDLTTNLLLLKIDSLGNTVWAKILGGSNVDAGMEIITTSDGNLAMIGYTNSFGAGGYDVYFVKADIHGTVLLSRTYGGADWDLGYSIAETSDGGFVLTGETYSSGSGSNDAFILKIDAIGDTVWAKEYGGAGSEVGWSIEEAMNGDLLLAGETSSTGAGQSDAWLIRVDNNGNLIWETTHGDTGTDTGRDMAELSNGNIMFAWNTIAPGNSYWSTLQSKIDPATGNEIDNQIFSSPFNYFSHKVITYTAGSTTLTVGYNAPGANLDDMMFFGLDTSGMNYDAACPGLGFGGNGPDYGKDIIATSDGGVALVGERNIGTGYSSVFVVKLLSDCIGTGTTEHDSIFVTGMLQYETDIVNAYPNPSQGIISINSRKKWEKIQVFSIRGRLLEEVRSNGNNQFETSLPSGMYILTVENNTEKVTMKLVVSR